MVSKYAITIHHQENMMELIKVWFSRFRLVPNSPEWLRPPAGLHEHHPTPGCGNVVLITCMNLLSQPRDGCPGNSPA